MSKKQNVSKKTRMLCEGALLVAAAIILSYFKIQFLAMGSINFAMVPIIIFAVHWGAGWGVGAGAVFGLLKFILAGGFAVNWLSVFLDYPVAYAAVGLAGLFHDRRFGLPLGALTGCLARFAVHFISGITIYRIGVPTEVMGMLVKNPWLYSLLYNISYMVPNIVIAVVVCLFLMKPLDKVLRTA